MVRPICSLVMLLALLPLVAGCGGAPFSFTPVEGTVTFEGGAPAAEMITITFTPQGVENQGAEAPPASDGVVEPGSGKFSVSFKKHKGAVIARHKVEVTYIPKGSYPPKPGQDGAPKKMTVTPAEVNVSSDKTSYSFTVKK